MENKIVRWLDDRGYSLEMRVAQVLRKAGLSVVQSEFYRDVESKDSRETDVVAYHSHVVKPSQLLVALVIECKVSTDKPWVLFSHDGQFNTELAIQRHAFTFYTQAAVLKASALPAAQELSLFALPKRTGYSMVVALGEQNDKAYSALMSVLSATKGIVEELKHKGSQNLHAFGVPIVVLKGRLFEAFLTEEDELTIHEIHKGTLAWRNPVLGVTSFVTVYTESGFEAAAATLAGDSAKFAEMVVNEIGKPVK